MKHILLLITIFTLVSCQRSESLCDICVENNYDLKDKYSDSFQSITRDQYKKTIKEILSKKDITPNSGLAPLTWQVPARYLDSIDLLVRDSCVKNGKGLITYFLDLERCFK